MDLDSTTTWAEEEFGHAELGDVRRRARLVRMARQVARRPRGTVTGVFDEAAAREGAFRFLESKQFSSRDLQAAAQVATARRAAAHPFVYVAADQTALQITDRSKQNFGPLARKDTVTGAQAMSALAISPTGEPLGLTALTIWTRTEERVTVKHDLRPISERETQFWLDVMSQTTTVLGQHAPATMPWFQIDRGGDASHVLSLAAKLGVAFTIRSSIERRVHTPDGRRYLHRVLATARRLGRYWLPLRTAPKRPARMAQIEVRARQVVLDMSLGLRGGAPRELLTLWAVEAREVATNGVEEPVLWRLLTNRAVTTFADAREVIDGYTMRWRVEDFHLAWKSGTCNIEDSRLRNLEHFTRWATILATVAVRAQRLKTVSRETPDIPATAELSRDEIDAVIILRKPKGVDLGADPTLGQVVRWIADIGGYTGKSSGGPPGVRILSRALDEVRVAADVLTRLRSSPS